MNRVLTIESFPKKITSRKKVYSDFLLVDRQVKIKMFTHKTVIDDENVKFK